MRSVALLSAFVALGHAHIAAWNKGMYCKGGPDLSIDNPNTNTAVTPLYNLTFSSWFLQRHTGCDLAPPPSTDDEFLLLPAGGSFRTELATNRAFTTLSYNGTLATEWQDGATNRSMPWRGVGNPPECLNSNEDGKGGELHARSWEHAAGTAWAVSYEPGGLEGVRGLEDLVVFSVRYHTPFFRETWYDVPADMPECPEEGCYCAWLWVPDGCGEPNIYMQNHRCKVVNATSSARQLGTPKPPVWCRDDPALCVTGPKQMIAWNQADGNNVDDVPAGQSPGYNFKMGFQEGAQTDIFV